MLNVVCNRFTPTTLATTNRYEGHRSLCLQPQHLLWKLLKGINNETQAVLLESNCYFNFISLCQHIMTS